MSKTFRLQDDTVPGFNNGEDWFYSTKYDTNLISEIKDPDGGKGNIPTSIPSPFARMELVNNAFKLIAESHDFEGTTVNHKLISDTLDIAELLFNYNIDSIKNSLSIVKWRFEDLDELEGSDIVAHRQFGKTLKLYVSQDAEYFNFQYINGLYIIKYDQQVIGCTSPLTLFFPSADPVEGVNLVFPNGDIPFDEKYCPLYRRDISFIEYIYSIKNEFVKFSQRFESFDNYLISCLEEIKRVDPQLYLRLKNSDYLNKVNTNYSTISTGTSIVEILSYSYKCQPNIISDIESDFVVSPSRSDTSGKLPLILKQFDGNDLSGHPRVYYKNGLWGQNYEVSPFINTLINERTLPYLDLKYPWLTISDFFEPALMKLVYPINTQCYYNAIRSTSNENIGFLIPLKKLYFDYFDTSFLTDNTTADGKPIFELNEVGAGNIQATLRIPIKKDYIEYQRIYFTDKTVPDEKKNIGIIQECQIGLTISPFFKTNNPDFNAFYRLQFIDRDIKPSTRKRKYDLVFFDSNGSIVKSLRKNRSLKEHDNVSSSYYSVEQEFDLIQVVCADIKGFIIPKFKSVVGRGPNRNTVAIDFGTTSTHIEYINGNNNIPLPFEFDGVDENHIGSLMDSNYPLNDRGLNGSGAIELIYLAGEEFLPEKIGRNEDYYFPIRSVICEHKSLKIELDNAVGLGNLNIPFIYQKKSITKYNNLTTNLKWLNYQTDTSDRLRVKAFLENLFFLIRNKIILTNGNLDLTKIVWFHPSSMNRAKINHIASIMNSLHNKYISHNSKVNDPVLESIAPYYFYKRTRNAIVGNNPFLLIDIGGETTDIVLFENNTPSLLTSFRFAGNAIFGAGLNGECPIEQNGFVKIFEPEYTAQFNNSDGELESVFKTLLNQGNIKEITSFLFSLENNKKLIDRNESDILSFSKKLANHKDLKIVFILAYSAILFHVANILKNKEISLPRYVGFSGNGSKIINILTPDNSTIKDLTKCILEIVTGLTYKNGLDIIIDEKPKETTCKGGLLINGENTPSLVQEVFISNEIEKGYIPTYAEFEKNKLFMKSSVKEYSNYLEFLKTLNKEFNFKTNFDAEIDLKYTIEETLSKDIEIAISEGINIRKNEENDPDAQLDETTFFYPLSLNISRLSSIIATKI